MGDDTIDINHIDVSKNNIRSTLNKKSFYQLTKSPSFTSLHDWEELPVSPLSLHKIPPNRLNNDTIPLTVHVNRRLPLKSSSIPSKNQKNRNIDTTLLQQLKAHPTFPYIGKNFQNTPIHFGDLHPRLAHFPFYNKGYCHCTVHDGPFIRKHTH